MAEMNTNEEFRGVQTRKCVTAIATILGILATLLFAFGAMLDAALGGRSNDLDGLAVINWMFAGCTTAVSVVGLIALFCGSHLGRHYSLAFSICLSSLAAAVSFAILSSFGLRVEEEWLVGAWSVWIVLPGIVGGAILTKTSCEYRDRARLGAAIGAGIALMIGLLVLSWPNRWMSDSDWATGILAFALLGGLPGAVCGAICDRVLRGRALCCGTNAPGGQEPGNGNA